MRKSLAIAGTSALSLAAVGFGASPAQAATVTTTCTNFTQHTIDETTQPGDNWYNPCLPQYGAGKVEFTIDSNVDFPAGFADLNDAPTVTQTSSIDSAAEAAYFTGTTTSPGFINLQKDAANSTPTSQRYTGSLVYQIASAQNIDPATLPAGCNPDGTTTYDLAYEVTYVPTTVTFVQTVNGQPWTYTFTSSPGPLVFGLPLNGNSVQGASCAADGSDLVQAAAGTDTNQQIVIQFAHVTESAFTNLSTLSPTPIYDPVDFSQSSIGNLGTFSRTDAPPATPSRGSGTPAIPACYRN